MKAATLEPTLDERLECSLEDLHECEQDIERLRKELSEYQAKTGMIVENGIPISFQCESSEEVHEVHKWLTDFKKRHYQAEQRFHSALRVWSGLKQGI